MNDLNAVPWRTTPELGHEMDCYPYVMFQMPGWWHVVSRSFGLLGDSMTAGQPIRLIDDDGQPLLNRRDGALLCLPRRVELPAPQLTQYARELGVATLTREELTGARRVGRGITKVAFLWRPWALITDTWAHLVMHATTALWVREELRWRRLGRRPVVRCP